MRRALILAALLAVLTACGGSSEAEPVNDAADTYTRLIKPKNDALLAFRDALGEGDEASMKAGQSAAVKLADANRAFAQSLSQTAWPTEVQDEIDTLVTAVAAEQGEWRQVADTDTYLAYASAVSKAAEQYDSGSGAYEAVRLALGLPEAT